MARGATVGLSLAGGGSRLGGSCDLTAQGKRWDQEKELVASPHPPKVWATDSESQSHLEVGGRALSQAPPGKDKAHGHPLR